MDIYRQVKVVSMGANRFEGVYYNVRLSYAVWHVGHFLTPSRLNSMNQRC